MSKSPNSAPTPTWWLLLAHPWGRVALAGIAVALLLILVAGIGLLALPGAPNGPGSPDNTAELPTAPDPAAAEAVLLVSETPAPSPEAITPEAEATPEIAATTPEAVSEEIPESDAVPANAEPETPVAAEMPGPELVEVPVAAPDHIVVEVTEDGKVVPGAAASQAELVEEVKRLNEKFDQLQETVNLVVTQMMSDVEAENSQLRAEVQRLQSRDQAGLLSSAFVPRPAGELLNSLADEARGMTEEELEANVTPEVPPAPFAFSVLTEWGREPEAVARLGGNAPTLKGVVGTVPKGSFREDIEQLGHDLRAQYADYDNINIEVFDDPVAAQAFADTQTLDPERRVLSVSKYSATNRDAITYYESGESTDLPVEQVDDANGDNGAPEAETEPATPEPPAQQRGRRSGR